MSPSVFCVVDDKHIPLYRVLWVSDTPHFCGDEDCNAEGLYEIRLEQDESIFCNRVDRDKMLASIETWICGPETDGEWPE